MGLLVSTLLLIAGLVILTDAVTLPTSITDSVDPHTAGWICIICAIVGFLIILVTRGDNRFGRERKPRR